MICEYGCNQEAQFEFSNGKMCCSKYFMQCPEVKAKNSDSIKRGYKNGRSKANFSKEAQRNSIISRINNLKEKPFETWGYKLTRETVLEEQNHKCAECPQSLQHNGKPLCFELDHIDGDNGNNKRENVRMLCPNCHSQTITFRGKNINSGKKKVEDDVLLEALDKYPTSIAMALKSVGLAAKGGNYNRAKRLLNIY